MAWWDDLIAAIQSTYWAVAQEVQNDINNAISGVQGTLGWIAGGIQNSIWSATGQVGTVLNGIYQGLSGAISTQVSAVQNTVQSVEWHLRDQIDEVSSDVGRTVSNIVGGIEGQISGQLSNVMGAVYGATNAITSGISSLQSNIQGTLNSVTSTISSGINSAINQVTGVVSGITSSLEQAINQGLGWLSQNLGGIVTTVQADIESVLGAVSQATGTVGEAIAASMANVVPSLDSIVKAIEEGGPLPDLAETLVKRVEDELAVSRQQALEMINKKVEVMLGVTQGKYKNFDSFLSDLADPAPVVGAVALVLIGIIIAPAMGQIISLVTEPMYTPARQGMWKLMPNKTLTPAELAMAVVQNVLPQNIAAENAALSGIDTPVFDQLVRLAGEPPGLEMMLELWRRGFMTESEVTQGVLESRLKPKYTETVKKLRYILPSLNDVIRMAVREAWRDDIAAKYGYDQDYPAEVADFAPQIGVDPDWIRRYWRAHWELPSIQMVLEMLHRTRETGITPDDVDTFLRVQDVPAYWREKIRAVSYSPYTRVDVRRMYKTRVLNRDQVMEAYRALGYSEERAKNLTEFTVRLEDEVGQLNPDALERKIYAALEALYIRDKRSEGDLRATMQKFGWGDEAITDELEIAKLKREAHQKIEETDASGLTTRTLERRIVEQLIDLYKKGGASLGDVQGAMQEFGWGPEIVDLMTRAANLEAQNAGKTTRKETLRELSISAILDAYESHTFTADQAQERLVAIGLSPDDAGTEIAIRDYHIVAKLRNSIVTALRDAFFNNDISETQLNIGLSQYGFDANEIAGYTALWTIEKSLKRKRFSEAQLASFVKHDVITAEQYADELTKQGYTQEQIEWLLKLRGAV